MIAIGGFAVSSREMIYRDAYHIDWFAKGYRLILNMSHLLRADSRTESQLTVPEASDEETQHRMTLRSRNPPTLILLCPGHYRTALYPRRRDVDYDVCTFSSEHASDQPTL